MKRPLTSKVGLLHSEEEAINNLMILVSASLLGLRTNWAHEILVSAHGPLVFVFLCLGLRGLGPGLDKNVNFIF